MSATTKRKSKSRSKKEGQRLAITMFRKGRFTSQWSEEDAVCYFNMFKFANSVMHSGANDNMGPVEWYVNEEREVLSREIGDES